MKPIIILNFKTYAESTGTNAVKLAALVRKVGKETGVMMIVAPQVADIYRISTEVDIPIYAQHINGVSFGGYTGHILAESVAQAGASGTLINHSEQRLELAEIDASLQAARRVGISTVVCTNNLATTAAAASLSPDFVAIEPPELIGSGIPVSKANPEIVIGAVKSAEGVKVLCGAGISKGDDVLAAIELGTHGVFLASGVVKASDPEAALRGLVELV